MRRITNTFIILILSLLLTTSGCIEPFSGTDSTVGGGDKTVYVNVNTDSSDITNPLADVIERIKDSVCEIVTEKDVYVDWFGSKGIQSGAGSAVIYEYTDDTVRLITCYHVVYGVDRITVVMTDGSHHVASLVAYDASKGLAIIEMSSNGIDREVYAPVDMDEDGVRLAEPVIAIGNPLGLLGGSVTKGHVSTVSRNVTINSRYTVGCIQTDANINTGNEGGGLFDMDGELVGIVVGKQNATSSSNTKVEGIAYAIPMGVVDRFLEANAV